MQVPSSSRGCEIAPFFVRHACPSHKITIFDHLPCVTTESKADYSPGVVRILPKRVGGHAVDDARHSRSRGCGRGALSPRVAVDLALQFSQQGVLAGVQGTGLSGRYVGAGGHLFDERASTLLQRTFGRRPGRVVSCECRSTRLDRHQPTLAVVGEIIGLQAARRLASVMPWRDVAFFVRSLVGACVRGRCTRDRRPRIFVVPTMSFEHPAPSR